MKRVTGAAAGFLLGAAPGAFGETLPFLSLPVDCTLGDGCFVTALVDHDLGLYSTDHACGTLTRDGHTGTDFTLPDTTAMEAGVAVLAAAPGTVIASRDGYPDTGTDFGEDACGNAVVISHGDGWSTQYCHLKQGSVEVREGQRVAMGAEIGMIGRSGAASLPHLDMILRRGDTLVDPFAPATRGCGNGEAALWTDPVSVPPAGFLKTGFATATPDYDAIRDRTGGATGLSATAPIIAWVSGYGSRPGDVLTTKITQGASLFMERTVVFERRREAWFRFAGRRYTDTPWPRGTYTTTLTLKRQGDVIAETTFSADLR